MIDYAPDVKELMGAMHRIDGVCSPGLYNAQLLAKAKKKYPKEYEEYKNYYLELDKQIQAEKKKLNRIKRLSDKFWNNCYHD